MKTELQKILDIANSGTNPDPWVRLTAVSMLFGLTLNRLYPNNANYYAIIGPWSVWCSTEGLYDGVWLPI